MARDAAVGAGRHARARSAALAAVLLVTLVQSSWNALQVPPLKGYDEPGHVGYMLTIVREGRLPLPLEGWSTFHPPLYYLAASGIWRLAEPWGPHALLVALRSLGIAAALVVGAVAFRLLEDLGVGLPATVVASLLTIFVPVHQLATAMLGNESIVTALVALALFSLVRLQREPGHLGNALAAGVATGLALATKYTAIALLPACAAPYLRARLGPADRRGAAALVLATLVIAGPVYVRNWSLTGTPLPMTRTLEPMRSAENGFVLRPRRPSDYWRIPWSVFRNPTIYSPRPDAPGGTLNRDMLSVPGLVFAGIWYDPYETRVPHALRLQGSWLGAGLLASGVIPTLLCLAGFVAATSRMLETRFRTPDAPLTLFAWCSLVLFVVFTWRAPALVAAKASYLLPVVTPAAWFFCRGVALVGPRWSARSLAVSCVATLASLAVFTERVAFEPAGVDSGVIAVSTVLDRALPGTHLLEAYRALGVTVAPAAAPPAGGTARSAAPESGASD